MTDDVNYCSDPVVFRFTWPGHNEAYTCIRHAVRLREVAEAAGFTLQLIQVSALEVLNNHCSQKLQTGGSATSEDEHGPTCRACGTSLEIDEEYMLSTYGAAWTYMPEEAVVWYCHDCENAGPLNEIALLDEGA